jgi:hypothetical protein
MGHPFLLLEDSSGHLTRSAQSQRVSLESGTQPDGAVQLEDWAAAHRRSCF